MSPNLTVYCTDENKLDLAKVFAKLNNYDFSDKLPVSTPLYFSFDGNPPVLHDTNINSSISIDFTSGGLAHRLQYGGGKGQTIAKAIGITSKNKPHILDATAGLGRDSLILANLGCQISLIEQSPVLAEMLDQAITSASDNPLFQQATQYGFKLYHADATTFMNNKVIPESDVVYLDPMYPHKKKSALVKKDMQILQSLIGHSSEETNTQLLAAALDFARQRVVVKRPKSAVPLDGPPPTMSLHSKKTRYDVYVIKTIKA
ncbi:MAG: class I SAM-dependent methyltransferase [Gammaproteobacteria bacterium]|nr:class I SAM-dependent methyltransferase [Gammaproteobacteria bacterium]